MPSAPPLPTVSHRTTLINSCPWFRASVNEKYSILCLYETQKRSFVRIAPGFETNVTTRCLSSSTLSFICTDLIGWLAETGWQRLAEGKMLNRLFKICMFMRVVTSSACSQCSLELALWGGTPKCNNHSALLWEYKVLHIHHRSQYWSATPSDYTARFCSCLNIFHLHKIWIIGLYDEWSAILLLCENNWLALTENMLIQMQRGLIFKVIF